MTGPARRVFRVVLGLWLVGWFINAPGDPGFLKNFRDALAVPLEVERFPHLLTDPRVGLAIYLAPLLAIAAWSRPDRYAKGGATLLVVSSLGALLHLETCSDATFTTSFWVSLWLAWLAFSGHRDDAAFYATGRGSAHAVLGLVFLGGFLGKCTPEYWTGQAFYGLYFSHEMGFPYPYLRAHWPDATVRAIAMWFSRLVVAGEGLLVLAPILPTRFVLGAFSVTMVTMMVARNYHLFSVLGCLLGLIIGAELLRRHELAVTGARAR